MNSLAGMNVVASPFIKPIPRVQFNWDNIGIDGPEPKGVRELNEWLKDRFGTEERIFIVGNTAYVSPQTMAQIRGLTK